MKWKNTVREIVIVLIGTMAFLALVHLLWKNGFLTNGTFNLDNQFNIGNYAVSVMSNGWLVFLKNAHLIFSLFNCITFGGIIITSIIRAIYDFRLDFSDYLTLGMVGSFIVLFVVGLLIIGLGIFTNVNKIEVVVLILNVILGAHLYYSRIFSKAKTIFDSNVFLVTLGLVLLFFVVYLVRLALISSTQFPLYFDSITHYSNIQSLLSTDKVLTINRFHLFFINYYHFGFHVSAAGITSISGKPIQDVMLVFGQTILAIIPLPMYFLVKHETKMKSAGFFTTLLGALGWYMPAYSVNWGKYPAITSLIIIEFTLCIAYLMMGMEKGNQKMITFGLFFVALSSSVLTHSRSLFVILLAIASWLAVDTWQNLSRSVRLWLFISVLIGITTIMMTIYREPVLRSVFDPYLREGSLTTLLVLFLFPFAMIEYPKIAFANLLMIFSLLFCLFVPAPFLFSRYGYQTLLDRPYIEIILYLPLSLMGGVGFAALMKTLEHLFDGGIQARKQKSILSFLTVVLWAGVIYNALLSYNFYASDCCKLTTNDDLNAYNWINQNLPRDALLWIASSKGSVSPSESAVINGATDGGGWVTPLAHRETKEITYSSDFGVTEVRKQICESNNNYIYVGTTSQSFDGSKMENVPDWYKMVYSSSEVQIFHVVGCAQ